MEAFLYRSFEATRELHLCIYVCDHLLSMILVMDLINFEKHMLINI